MCVNNSVLENDINGLKNFFLEYADHADDIDFFNYRVEQLTYHGYLELLTNGYRIGWKKVKKSDKIIPLGIEEYAENGCDFELLILPSKYSQSIPRR